METATLEVKTDHDHPTIVRILRQNKQSLLQGNHIIDSDYVKEMSLSALLNAIGTTLYAALLTKRCPMVRIYIDENSWFEYRLKKDG